MSTRYQRAFSANRVKFDPSLFHAFVAYSRLQETCLTGAMYLRVEQSCGARRVHVAPMCVTFRATPVARWEGECSVYHAVLQPRETYMTS